MSKHTKGPWKIGFSSYPTPVYGKKNEHIAWMDGSANEVGKSGLTPVGQANAQLIAAAPELLSALKALREWSKNEYQSNAILDKQVDAVIAKAEGTLDGVERGDE